MHNDPELNGKYLGTISQDFVKVADILKESSYQIRKRGFEYPVFPIARIEQPIGMMLIPAQAASNEWNYYASFLDEFVQRALVSGDKVDDFKKTFKDPDEFCCLFVVDEAFTNFVYIPFPED